MTIVPNSRTSSFGVEETTMMIRYVLEKRLDFVDIVLNDNS